MKTILFALSAPAAVVLIASSAVATVERDVTQQGVEISPTPTDAVPQDTSSALPAGVTKTKGGLKFDANKYQAKQVKLKSGQKAMALFAKGKTASVSTAAVGMICSGCEGCGASVDTTNSELKCRSLGCTTCKGTVIVGDGLKNIAEVL